MTDEISNLSIGNLSTTNMSNLEHSKYPALGRTGADHLAARVGDAVAQRRGHLQR